MDEKETFSDLIKDLPKRLSFPFIWSFIIAFSIFNWRVIIYLVGGDLTPLERINRIAPLTDASISSDYWKQPLIYALIVTAIFPLGSLIVSSIYSFFKIQESNIAFFLAKKFDKSPSNITVNLKELATGTINQCNLMKEILHRSSNPEKVVLERGLGHIESFMRAIQNLDNDQMFELVRKLKIGNFNKLT